MIISLDDLFSSQGGKGLEKILEGLKEVNKEFTSLTKNLAKQGKILDTQLDKTAKSADNLADSVKKADNSSEKGRKDIENQSKAVDDLYNKTKKLVDSQKQLGRFEEQTAASVKELTISLERQVAEFRKFQAQGNDKELQRISKEIRVTSGQVNALNAAQKKLNQTLNVTNRSYDGLVKENKELVAIYKRLNPEITKERTERTRLAAVIRSNTLELKRLDSALDRNFRNVGNYISAQQQSNVVMAKSEGALSGVDKQVTRLSSSFASSLLAIASLTAGLREVIRLNSEVSDSFADVRKTTGLTDLEVRQLAKSLKQLNTRTTLDGLLKIAEIGGRLNIANDELLSFTKSVDIAAVALGDNFSGGIEEVATSLGKITGLFEETRELRIDEAFSRAGSSLNELDASTRATASNITDFALRIGQLPESIRPIVQDAFSLGATLEEVGLNAERASRPLAIFLTRAAGNTAAFAKQIGITEEAARDLINTDVTEFTKLFAQSLRGLSATETANVFSELQLKADGVRSVLGALATQTERLTEIQNISNKSFEEATSLLDEFDLKNNTLGGSIDKLGNAFSNFFTSTGTTGFLTNEINGLALAIRNLGNSDVSIFTRLGALAPGSLDRIKLYGEELKRQRTEEAKQQSIQNQAQMFYNDLLNNENLTLGAIERATKQNINQESILLRIKELQAEAAKKEAEQIAEAERKRKALIEERIAQEKEVAKAVTMLNRQIFERAIFENEQIAKSAENTIDERITALREGAQAEIGLLNQTREAKQSALDSEFTEEEQRTSESYKKRTQIILNETQLAIDKIEAKLAQDSSKLIIKLVPKISSTENASEDLFSVDDIDTGDAEKLGNALGKKIKEGLKDALTPDEIKKEIFDGLIETATDIFNGITEARIRSLDDQLAALQNQRQAELQLASNNKQAQAAIDARFAEKEKQLRIQRAKEERKQALFNIAIDTAVNAVRLYAQTVPPGILSAFAVAQGLAQAAIVASQPLPQFEKGTSSSPEGPAIVDERGAELIQKPDGTFEMGQSKGPRLTYLEKGSKVFTAPETNQIIRDAQINQDNDQLIRSYKEGQRTNEKPVNEEKLASMIVSGIGGKLEKTVGNIPINQTSLTEKGLEYTVIRNQMRQKRRSARYK